MKAFLLRIAFFFFLINQCFSQTLIREKSYGGTSEDLGHSAIKLNGEYWTVSESGSSDFDVINNHNYSGDAWIMCLDPTGAILKSKCFGASYEENGQKIISTFDNCLVVAGYGSSSGWDLAGSSWHGGKDFWVFKIDTAMNLIWSRCIGGSAEDFANSIVQTADSGFLVVGESKSVNWNVPGHYGSSFFSDIYLAKLNKDGVFQWGKKFGGSGDDQGIDVVQTNDGGILLLGFTNSTDFDLSFAHLGQIVVFKVDSIGNVLWKQTYGGSTSEVAHKLLLNNDGSFYIAGGTMSSDGQVTNHVAYMDGWILKIDSTGNLIWQSCIGSNGEEEAVTLCKTISGNLMVGFSTFFSDGIFHPHGINGDDIFMALLDTNGNYISGNNFGGSKVDNVYDVIPIDYNRNLLIGETESNDFDVSFSYGINQADVWIAEISDGGSDAINHPAATLKDIRASINNGKLNINLFCEKKQNLQLRIFDTAGKCVFYQEVNVSIGINHLDFPLDLSLGLYIMSLSGINQENVQLKLVVFN